MRVFAVYFWHSAGWTPRDEALMEAVVKQARTTRYPWLIACDANMNPEDFKESLWYKGKHMFIVARGERTSTCRPKGPSGELIVRTYHYLSGGKRQRSSGLARARHAKSLARKQWWDVARKEQS